MVIHPRVALLGLGLGLGLAGCVRALEPWPSRGDLASDQRAGLDRAGPDLAGLDHAGGERGPLDRQVDSGESLLDGLQAYWKLDESAAPLRDASGHGMDLTYVAATTVTLGAAGRYGKGASITPDGVTGYAADRITSNDFDTTSWPGLSTLLWIKGTSLAGCAINVRDLHLALFLANGLMHTMAMDVSGGTCGACSSSPALGDGQWHQVGVVVRGGELLHIVDGKRHDSCPCTGSFVRDGYHMLFLGSTYGTAGNVFSGQLDEVGVWSRGLSDAELERHYQQELVLQTK